MQQIIRITTQHNGRHGSRGILTEIARRLGVTRAAVSAANRNPQKFSRIAAALVEYQKHGRLPEPTDQAHN